MASDSPTAEDFDRLKMAYEPSEAAIARMEETLRYVREKGHPYVDIREGASIWGKRLIYFCALCLEPCNGDTCLFDHMNDRRHTELVVTAQRTLLKPNPWPFNDGMFFFHDHTEEEQSKSLPASDKGKGKLLDTHNTAADSLAKVKSSNLGPVASSLKSDKKIQ